MLRVTNMGSLSELGFVKDDLHHAFVLPSSTLSVNSDTGELKVAEVDTDAKFRETAKALWGLVSRVEIIN